MYVAYLAGSAGRVVIPGAVDVAANDADNEVSFIDRDGAILVTFRRPDLAVYSRDGDPLGELMAREDGHQPIQA